MQCTAHTKSTGKRCKKDAIKGGTVCGGRSGHGGSAPQVKRKAKERLEALVDPAIDRIQKTIAAEPIMTPDGKTVIESIPPGVALTAARDILDRTGHKPVEKHEDVTPESDEVKLLKEVFTLEELKKIRERLSK